MHVIIVTVGLSIIDKSWKGEKRYEDLMGSEDGMNRGLLADFKIEDVENGSGWKARSSIPSNRYSAEVSSLYALMTDKKLEPEECRIVLLATDSPEGVFAARLNKRVIAQRLFGCAPENVLDWHSEADNDRLGRMLSQIPILKVDGLQVGDALTFERRGNLSLQRAIYSQESYLGPEDLKIVNVTGGFKGVIPIVVGIAWKHDWEVTYLYEETEHYLILQRPKWIRLPPGKETIEKIDEPASQPKARPAGPAQLSPLES
ncbi:MAG: hypothetical protein HY268_02365 [Deltaproteobacteria bacterium]|nr:hypothetical protein [Deltaproteobacteria bacterium]